MKYDKLATAPGTNKFKNSNTHDDVAKLKRKIRNLEIPIKIFCDLFITFLSVSARY